MLAKTLAKEVAKIAILNLWKEAEDKLANEIPDGLEITSIGAANVVNKEALEKVHQEVLDELEPCEILINVADGNPQKGTTSKEHITPDPIDNESPGSIFDLDPKGIRFVFNLNFKGKLIPTQIFNQDIIEKRDCFIGYISPMNPYALLTKLPAYRGAKTAVNTFIQRLTFHFAKAVVTFNGRRQAFFRIDQNCSTRYV